MLLTVCVALFLGVLNASAVGVVLPEIVADLDEMASNDFNLNISRYVDTTEPVEVMSVEDAEQRRDEALALHVMPLYEQGWPGCLHRRQSGASESRTRPAFG